MSEPVKFLFDRNLGPSDGSDQEPDTITLDEHHALVERASQEAHAVGLAEGRRQAASEADAIFAAGTSTITEALSRIFGTLDQEIAAHEAAAVRLGLAVSQNLAPVLVAHEPLVEIEALFGDCVSQLRSTPHLAVRLHDDLVASANARLKPIADAAGYQGRLIIIGTPDIRPGDCQIDWAEGSIVRSADEFDATVRQKVQRYLTARGAATKEDDNG